MQGSQDVVQVHGGSHASPFSRGRWHVKICICWRQFDSNKVGMMTEGWWQGQNYSHLIRPCWLVGLSRVDMLRLWLMPYQMVGLAVVFAGFVHS
jgi:hypothetical protein